ncbi:unnamed protein product, partial [Mesorhabditis spiculigera]
MMASTMGPATALLLCCLSATPAFAQAITPTPLQDITPVPMDKFNPRLTEFRRIDGNSDEKLTFTEFLLSDKDYIEAKSREFHAYDKNKDGQVTRAEYEAYYERDGHRHGPEGMDHDFFGGLDDHPPFRHFFGSPMRHSHETPSSQSSPEKRSSSPGHGDGAPFYRRLGGLGGKAQRPSSEKFQPDVPKYLLW